MTTHPGSQNAPSPEDFEAVAAQLGREPRGQWSVARRCACGKPQVIRTASRLGDGTPFPTLWWLTCKALVRRVGALEAGGLITEINHRLARDEPFREALAGSTEKYNQTRDGVSSGLNHPGGGPGRVKCLHAHVAHDMICGDNPVGRLVLEKLAGAGWSEPEEPCV